MLDRNQFMPLNYFKKTDYFGSLTGMRFKIGKATVPYTEQELQKLTEEGKEIKEGEGATVLRATIWPGPFCYVKTAPELTYCMDFSFNKEGIDASVDWVNAEYLKDKDKWDNLPFWTPEMSRIK